MNFSTKNQVALVIALMASTTGRFASAESGRPSEPMAQAVAAGACEPAPQAESRGSYYTYLRVVDGMTRDSALQAARNIDGPIAARARVTASAVRPGIAPEAPVTSGALR